jgi:tol-pal system protein YbgF
MMRHAFHAFLPAVVSAATLLAATPVLAQMSAEEMVMRLDRLEGQIRQLTGTVEELQHRNQQLDQSLRRLQEDNEFRFQELGGKGGARPGAAARPATTQPQPQYQPQQPQYQQPQPQYQPAQPQYQQPPAGSGRRSDVFDPSQNPAAPGAPRTLGSTSPSAPLTSADNAGVGAPGGREAGAPLDLSTSVAPAADGGLPPPPPRNPSATGTQMAASSPRDQFDQAYNALMRKDYAAAETGFRAFLQRNTADRLAPDAQYWLGESMFQRQNWREAADAFLSMSKAYEKSPKAAEALLRLGQSLAMLREKELACATFGEIERKYPRASTSIKQAVEREQKRVRC